MQPTEHMKPSEDELIAHVKESLSDYEEAYVPGAWENFNKKEKKKPLLWIWSLSGAAAVLLIVAGLFVFVKSPEKAENLQVVKVTPTVNGSDVKAVGIKTTERVKDIEVESDDAVTADLKSTEKTGLAERILHNNKQGSFVRIAENNTAASNKTVASHNMAVSQTPSLIQAKATDHSVPVQQPDAVIAQANPVVNVKADLEINKAPVDANTAMKAFLEKESQLNASTKSTQKSGTKENKWEMGLMVAPSFGNTKKLNMGYGVNMAYALSSKVSLSSGISYNEMTASKNIVGSQAMDAPAASSLVSETKSLESIEARLVGIDIPLEIKYHIGKNIYAGVGVSAFAVLNPKRNNTYLEGKVVERSVDQMDGTQQSKMFLVSERVVENAPVEPEIKDGRYLGFYNFSFGYKQKISKNKSVAIEPFMKVPMKDITKENLRLLGTGVRLKFDF